MTDIYRYIRSIRASSLTWPLCEVGEVNVLDWDFNSISRRYSPAFCAESFKRLHCWRRPCCDYTTTVRPLVLCFALSLATSAAGSSKLRCEYCLNTKDIDNSSEKPCLDSFVYRPPCNIAVHSESEEDDNREERHSSVAFGAAPPESVSGNSPAGRGTKPGHRDWTGVSRSPERGRPSCLLSSPGKQKASFRIHATTSPPIPSIPSSTSRSPSTSPSSSSPASLAFKSPKSAAKHTRNK